jgi:predicted TIM-barrel fold metal-dependent hydrolase
MLVDAHTHFDSTRHHPRLISDMKRMGAEQFCVLVIEQFDSSPSGFKQAEAIWLKLREPDRAFVFGGLDYTGLFGEPGGEPEVPLVEQVQTLRAMGFDGVKLISGKPNVRHAIGRRLDGPEFEPMLRWLEETHFPILWHVGDPPEFWDREQVPRWAREKGWWYEPPIPPKDQIDREIAAIFAKHPRLNLILPHFFFLSDRLDEAAQLLERYPGFYLDLAPGIEMLHNFTKDHAQAREFFLRFHSRIIFGTDIGLMEHCNSPDRGVMVRRFLETDDVFPVPDDPAMTPDDRPDLKGIHLPQPVLDDIFCKNFHRVIGRTKPQPLNRSKTRSAVRDLAERCRRHRYDDETTQQVLRELA